MRRPWRRFTFSLAMELKMTHAELLARVSSAELSEWQAYLQLENKERQERQVRSDMSASATAGVQTRKQRMRRR